eukprot:CAMPEP_0177638220 /NCGR_PEP_ID=MMETSP0447-20121125/5374_1 /TAXON_ID=0 /ORGANISM="Stygamoeba regulata, Strain BSH-02190019" /LENGTH=179 /DNA_ID=CAMNT_0019140171 /DNA_START=228 /DNA_END=764 /DNA_ORIENTATION=-
MSLEATFLCLDTSEWMRNGDYSPSRLEIQADAANREMLITLSSDIGCLLECMTKVKVEGKIDIVAALKTVQLALKHRQNKAQRQRAILFVGSPVCADKAEVVRMAKRLKKNNVAVDVISFGEVEENAEVLQALVDNVNANGNSHILTVPPGPHILSDQLWNSPIIMTNASGGGGSGSGG